MGNNFSDRTIVNVFFNNEQHIESGNIRKDNGTQVPSRQDKLRKGKVMTRKSAAVPQFSFSPLNVTFILVHLFQQTKIPYVMYGGESTTPPPPPPRLTR